VKHRWELINWLIAKRGYESYLEIGVKDGYCYNQVKCLSKTGIDIKLLTESPGTIEVSSDEFFKGLDKDEEFDIIFVDGDHRELQVNVDIHNALKALAEDGVVVVHDCNPKKEEHATPERGENQPLWCGTAYRAFLTYRAVDDRLLMSVVDMDWGCGVIIFGKQKRLDLPENYGWEDFDKNRVEWLNLISVDDFRRKFR